MNLFIYIILYSNFKFWISEHLRLLLLPLTYIYVAPNLLCRYANRSSLVAIQLMNEPLGINLESLKKYYQAGYDAIRKHTSSAYVIMSNPLDRDSKVLLSFAEAFNRVVIDVHYYSLFSDKFSNMNVQQNIDYIKIQRASDLSSLTTSNGPLIFVGKFMQLIRPSCNDTVIGWVAAYAQFKT